MLRPSGGRWGQTERSGRGKRNSAGQEVMQALHDVDKRRLSDIERAIQKIDEGTYGLSDSSDKAIPQARRRATPEAIFTVQEEDQREKRGDLSSGRFSQSIAR